MKQKEGARETGTFAQVYTTICMATRQAVQQCTPITTCYFQYGGTYFNYVKQHHPIKFLSVLRDAVLKCLLTNSCN